MAIFYLIRHGEANYAEKNTKIYQGFGENLAPLTEKGVLQIKESAKDKRLTEANLILSSPYTRALQSAAILSKEIQQDIIVETDLHEWVANKNYCFEQDEIAAGNYKEFKACAGIYPADQPRDWEDYEGLQKRVLAVLERYKQYEKVVVVCHGTIIQSLTHGYRTQNGEIVEIELK